MIAALWMWKNSRALCPARPPTLRGSRGFAVGECARSCSTVDDVQEPLRRVRRQRRSGCNSRRRLPVPPARAQLVQGPAPQQFRQPRFTRWSSRTTTSFTSRTGRTIRLQRVQLDGSFVKEAHSNRARTLAGRRHRAPRRACRRTRRSGSCTFVDGSNRPCASRPANHRILRHRGGARGTQPATRGSSTSTARHRFEGISTSAEVNNGRGIPVGVQGWPPAGNSVTPSRRRVAGARLAGLRLLVPQRVTKRSFPEMRETAAVSRPRSRTGMST